MVTLFQWHTSDNIQLVRHVVDSFMYIRIKIDLKVQNWVKELFDIIEMVPMSTGLVVELVFVFVSLVTSQSTTLVLKSTT